MIKLIKNPNDFKRILKKEDFSQFENIWTQTKSDNGKLYLHGSVLNGDLNYNDIDLYVFDEEITDSNQYDFLLPENWNSDSKYYKKTYAPVPSGSYDSYPRRGANSFSNRKFYYDDNCESSSFDISFIPKKNLNSISKEDLTLITVEPKLDLLFGYTKKIEPCIFNGKYSLLSHDQIRKINSITGFNQKFQGCYYLSPNSELVGVNENIPLKFQDYVAYHELRESKTHNHNQALIDELKLVENTGGLKSLEQYLQWHKQEDLILRLEEVPEKVKEKFPNYVNMRLETIEENN